MSPLFPAECLLYIQQATALIFGELIGDPIWWPFLFGQFGIFRKKENMGKIFTAVGRIFGVVIIIAIFSGKSASSMTSLLGSVGGMSIGITFIAIFPLFTSLVAWLIYQYLRLTVTKWLESEEKGGKL